jgi:hypothetical protein
MLQFKPGKTNGIVFCNLASGMRCCGSSSFFYDKITGQTTEKATKTFNKIATAAGLGSLIGLITSSLFFIVLIAISWAGFFSIDWLFDLVVSNKGIVFYFANVSVSSAYLAIKGSF